jgi:hypothetical protein
MNFFFTVTVFWAALIPIYAQRGSNFGSGDISNLLQNNAVIQQQINCVLERGPCDELGTMLKRKFILQLLVCLLVYLIMRCQFNTSCTDAKNKDEHKPRRPGFDPRSTHAEFMVDKMALGQIFLEYLGSPANSQSTECSSIIRGWYNRPTSGRVNSEWNPDNMSP